MITAPKVSIVIRNYNYAEFLPDALDSALNQTYSPVEIIVVDDGSTDRSREILDAYATRCLIVLQANGGEGSAVNAGFAAASGDIVLFLDADDVLAAETVLLVVSAWSLDVARIHFPMYLMNQDGTLRETVVPHFKVHNAELAEDLANFGQVVSGGQSFNAYAAWALRRILPLDPMIWRRAPDCYLNALTASQGRSEQIHTPLGGYRIHAGNLSLQNLLDDQYRQDVVLIHPRLYEAIRSFVGEDRWNEMHPVAPAYHWLNRIMHFLVNKNGHPYSKDKLGFLVKTCVLAILRKPKTVTMRRVMLMGGMLTLVVLPRHLRRALLPTMMRFSRATSQPVRGMWKTLFGLAPRHVHWRERFGYSSPKM